MGESETAEEDWEYAPDSGKSKWKAILLAIWLGAFGAQKWYLGADKSTVRLHFIFFWTFIPLLIALYEAVKMLFMDEDEFNSYAAKKYGS